MDGDVSGRSDIKRKAELVVPDRQKSRDRGENHSNVMAEAYHTIPYLPFLALTFYVSVLSPAFFQQTCAIHTTAS